MTQGSVSASKPFSSQSELRPDKLFQDQSTLWFCLQTRLSTRGHCVSVSGLTHLHEGAVSRFFSSIVKKKNHKSEISWWKNLYSLKNFTWFFFTLPFFNKNFFHLVLNRTYFFSYENTIQKVKLFYDTSEKKIHSALLLLSSTQMYLIFLRIFSTLFLRENFFFSMKNKNSLGSAHRISFSGCVFKENIFLHFSLRNSEKVRKKYSHWLFFFTQFHILFFLLLIFSEKI